MTDFAEHSQTQLTELVSGDGVMTELSPGSQPESKLTGEIFLLGDACLSELGREARGETIDNPGLAAAAERALELMPVPQARALRFHYGLETLPSDSPRNTKLEYEIVRRVLTHVGTVGKFAQAQAEGVDAVALLFPKRLEENPDSPLTFLYKVREPIGPEERLPDLVQHARNYLALRSDISPRNQRIIAATCGLEGVRLTHKEAGIPYGLATAAVHRVLVRKLGPMQDETLAQVFSKRQKIFALLQPSEREVALHATHSTSSSAHAAGSLAMGTFAQVSPQATSAAEQQEEQPGARYLHELARYATGEAANPRMTTIAERALVCLEPEAQQLLLEYYGLLDGQPKELAQLRPDGEPLAAANTRLLDACKKFDALAAKQARGTRGDKTFFSHITKTRGLRNPLTFLHGVGAKIAPYESLDSLLHRAGEYLELRPDVPDDEKAIIAAAYGIGQDGEALQSIADRIGMSASDIETILNRHVYLWNPIEEAQKRPPAGKSDFPSSYESFRLRRPEWAAGFEGSDQTVNSTDLKVVRAGLTARRSLLHDDTLKAHERAQLEVTARAGEDATAAVFSANSAIIPDILASIERSYTFTGRNRQEIVEAAQRGLWRAIELYDPNKNFAAYANKCIIRVVLREFDRQYAAFWGVTQTVAIRAAILGRAYDRISKRHRPSLEELAAATNLSINDANVYLDLWRAWKKHTASQDSNSNPD